MATSGFGENPTRRSKGHSENRRHDCRYSQAAQGLGKESAFKPGVSRPGTIGFWAEFQAMGPGQPPALCPGKEPALRWAPRPAHERGQQDWWGQQRDWSHWI